MFDAQVAETIARVNNLRHEVDDHMQIPAEEGLLLAQLVRLGRCRSICEIGVSYGFSTLHLAAAVRENCGHVQAVDLSDKKIKAAREHLRQAGLDNVVTLHQGDAREVVPTLTPDEPFDFVFIDAVKDQCFDYLAAVWPKLNELAILVTDNTVTHEAELRPFVEHLRNHPEIDSCQVAVGNGIELSVRRQRPD